MSDTDHETRHDGRTAVQPQVIVARAGRYYRNARYAMVVICIAAGLWFAYDGWKKWPAENAAARAKGHEKLPHSEELDIPIQRLLGASLPIVGLVMLLYFLYRSRGEYRLEGNMLSVPGHPPIPLENIRTIDKTKWDRKGIAHLEYEAPGSTETRRLTLDDFVYEQAPTDAILERIEAVLVPPGEGDDAPGSDPELADDADDAPTKERAEA